MTGLGGVPRFHTAALIAQTMDHLAAEKHERGRAVVVALDEAHLLSADQLEELRLLTNSEMDSVAPFTGLLLGQPTLRRRIKLGAFAALDQRIALRYALPGSVTPTSSPTVAPNRARPRPKNYSLWQPKPSNCGATSSTTPTWPRTSPSKPA